MSEFASYMYVPMPLFVMDEEMEVVQGSREMYALLGLRPHLAEEDRDGKLLSIAFENYAELLEEVGAATMKITSPRSVVKFEYRFFDKVYAITVFGVLSNGGSLFFGVVFKDVSEQLVYKQSLDDARLFLESVLNSLPLGVVVLNNKLQITQVNEAQHGLMLSFGYDNSVLDWFGHSWDELFLGGGDEFSSEQILESVIGAGEVLQKNMEQDTLAGERVVFSIHIAPLFNNRHEIVGAIRICEDITEKMHLAAELKDAEVVAMRYETLKQVAVTLNHKINNSLTTIDMSTQMLRRIPDLDEMYVGLLDSIDEQTGRLNKFAVKFMNVDALKTVNYLDSHAEKMIEL